MDKPSKEELVQGAIQSALLAGCTCTELEVDLLDLHDGLWSAQLYHDDDCVILMKIKRGNN